MRDFGEAAVGLFLDVVEGGENQVGDANSLSSVRHILALRVLNIGIHGFPVVGDEKDSVRALQGLGQRLRRTKVGLDDRGAITVSILL